MIILLADNPCPKLGNIVTVMLSENIEEVTQTDGTTVPMLVETHFQMNYTNGEWKRIKKNRRIVTEESTSTSTPGPNATATASNWNTCSDRYNRHRIYKISFCDQMTHIVIIRLLSKLLKSCVGLRTDSRFIRFNKNCYLTQLSIVMFLIPIIIMNSIS